MILIDPKGPDGQKVAREFKGYIRQIGVPCEIEHLPFGDFAFEGYGGLSVGIERKRLHDMLHCIDDSRFSAHQRLGLRQLYQEHYLLLEGLWRPHDPKGVLMEGNAAGQFWECRPGGRSVLYSKVRRYLFSVIRSGTPILYTRDPWHTAYDLVELYHYYSKREHTSQLEKQKLNIPSLNARPSLTRRWAEELDGIGLKMGEQAEKLFCTPIALAMSEELEWLSLDGVGQKTAASIVAQIHGTKKRQ